MICIVAVSVRVSRLRVCVNREGWAECMSVIKGPDENSWSSLRVSPGTRLTGRSGQHNFNYELVSPWSLTWSLSVSLGVETRAPCSVFPVSSLGLASEAHRVVLRGFETILSSIPSQGPVRQYPSGLRSSFEATTLCAVYLVSLLPPDHRRRWVSLTYHDLA